MGVKFPGKMHYVALEMTLYLTMNEFSPFCGLLTQAERALVTLVHSSTLCGLTFSNQVSSGLVFEGRLDLGIDRPVSVERSHVKND